MHLFNIQTYLTIQIRLNKKEIAFIRIIKKKRRILKKNHPQFKKELTVFQKIKENRHMIRDKFQDNQ